MTRQWPVPPSSVPAFRLLPHLVLHRGRSLRSTSVIMPPVRCSTRRDRAGCKSFRHHLGNDFGISPQLPADCPHHGGSEQRSAGLLPLLSLIARLWPCRPAHSCGARRRPRLSADCPPGLRGRQDSAINRQAIKRRESIGQNHAFIGAAGSQSFVLEQPPRPNLEPLGDLAQLLV